MRRVSISIIVLTIVLAFAAVIVFFGLYIERAYIKNQQRLTHLLCETDYEVLLSACRELSNRVVTGDLKRGAYWVRINKEPKASQFQFPQIILEINPVLVHLDSEGWVMLEMGGLPTYGVVAYPKDSKSDYSFQGDVELIPGLWYYNEDYRKEYPKLMKEIDALIQKGKMRQREKRNR
ncbi:MAG: hypothetical protein A2173_06265 [Planctomycetes bacterium RBG_13_44_8b]|nr:MAG: hypothetical protein A2173_06265 [Planctomycetes bacterium RBG_13_44_8b]